MPAGKPRQRACPSCGAVVPRLIQGYCGTCDSNGQARLAEDQAQWAEEERQLQVIASDPAAAADDAAVAAFAVAMAAKMAASRAKGRGGWQEAPEAFLWEALREHVDKGDPVDVANFAMMIWHVRRQPATRERICLYCDAVPGGPCRHPDPCPSWEDARDRHGAPAREG